MLMPQRSRVENSSIFVLCPPPYPPSLFIFFFWMLMTSHSLRATVEKKSWCVWGGCMPFFSSNMLNFFLLFSTSPVCPFSVLYCTGSPTPFENFCPPCTFPPPPFRPDPLHNGAGSFQDLSVPICISNCLPFAVSLLELFNKSTEDADHPPRFSPPPLVFSSSLLIFQPLLIQFSYHCSCSCYLLG